MNETKKDILSYPPPDYLHLACPCQMQLIQIVEYPVVHQSRNPEKPRRLRLQSSMVGPMYSSPARKRILLKLHAFYHTIESDKICP